MKNSFEHNKKFTEHDKISLNMKISSNTKKFTEYKTSSEYENEFCTKLATIVINRFHNLLIGIVFFSQSSS